MKPSTRGFLTGLISGLIAALLVMFIVSPSLMFREDVYRTDFDSTVAELEQAILEKGWKIPKVHDLQATMRKFDREVRAVKVFEICHPDHSYEILSRDGERIVSNMMPCRIAVYERADGSVGVSRMNSGLMARPMSKVIRQTMSDAAGEVEEIIARLPAE